METMSAFAEALLGAGAPATTRASDDATARADPIARAPPPGRHARDVRAHGVRR